MADVLVNALTQITTPTSTDSFVMVNRSTNEGQILDANTFLAQAGALMVDCGTVSSLPTTISDANVTSDMVVVNSYLGTPSAMTGNWTVATSNGSLTISGNISGSTSVKLYLTKGR